ncbi:hypothetical protein Btru_044590 [Bulinus truncatus]|nr:hypothetical protein Btru_044590 [Bulinus truncatus]
MATGNATNATTLISINILDLEINAFEALLGRRCDSHKEQVINFYCKKCHVAICHVCTVVTHRQHDGHRIFELNNLMKLYEQKFQRRREIHREILQSLDACLQHYDVICKLPSMKENLQKLIKRDLERNIKTLKVRADDLCGRIAETFDQQSAQLTSNKIILTELKNKLDSQISEFDNAKAKPDVVTALELYRKMKKEADKNKEMISEGSAAAKSDQLKVSSTGMQSQSPKEHRGHVLSKGQCVLMIASLDI